MLDLVNKPYLIRITIYHFGEPYKLARYCHGSVLRSNICHMIQNDLHWVLELFVFIH